MDTMIYKHVVNLHVSALFGHVQGDIQQSKIHLWLVISQICNKTFKAKSLNWQTNTCTLSIFYLLKLI